MDIETTKFEELGTWITYENKIIVDGQLVGKAYTMVDSEDEDQTYLETIDIDEDFRNQGFGTQAINKLAEQTDLLYFAPTDENNQRLYKRIAYDMEEAMSDVPEVDQGFGVYFLEK